MNPDTVVAGLMVTLSAAALLAAYGPTIAAWLGRLGGDR